MDKQEELCAKCLLGDTMLCPGTRDYFAEETSDFYGALKLEHRPCSKKEVGIVENELIARIRRTGIPEPIFAKYSAGADITCEIGGGLITFSDGQYISQQTRGDLSRETMDTMFSIAVSAFTSGHVVKYIYPQWVCQNYNKWEMWSVEDIITADLVIIQHIDQGSGADFIRNQLFSMVHSRIMNGLATLVTISDDPKPKTEVEKVVCEEVQSWESL
jgi:hypothetical protein